MNIKTIRSSLFSTVILIMFVRAVGASTPDSSHIQSKSIVVHEDRSSDVMSTNNIRQTPKPPNAINIRDYGAKGDGIADDTAAIQIAIDKSVAAHTALYIPSGTYLLNGPRRPPYSAILTIKSNLEIIGDGYNSVLKVHDDYTKGGEYRVMAPAAIGDVDNFHISGVRFDGNASHNLVIDSKANVRGAYVIKIFTGHNIKVEGCWFEEEPGRGIVNFGSSANPPALFNVQILNNVFKNVGGAIRGNELQNDHSSVYLQADGGLIEGNSFSNDNAFDPLRAPSRGVVAMEVHGRNTSVTKNVVRRYGSGGNLAATIHDSLNNSWTDNKFHEMYGNVLNIWVANGFRNINLVISKNIIHIDNTNCQCGSGIIQSTLAMVTSRPIENLSITDNEITFENIAPKAATNAGIFLVSADNLKIQNNEIHNAQGSGIGLETAAADIGFNKVNISGNKFYNCGISTLGSRIWSLFINNTRSDREFRDITVNNNAFVKSASLANAKQTPTSGIRITGSGRMRNIYVNADNSFENYMPAQRVNIINSTGNTNITAHLK